MHTCIRVCVRVGVCRHGEKDHLPGYMYAYVCVCVHMYGGKYCLPG